MRFIKSAVISLLATMVFLAPIRVFAAQDIFKGACQNAPNSTVCQDEKNKGSSNPIAGKNGVLQTTANIMAIIGGIAAVIIIVLGGIQYATAGGAAQGQRAGDNPNKAKNARQVVTNATIGLVVLALSWSIVSFIIQHVFP